VTLTESSGIEVFHFNANSALAAMSVSLRRCSGDSLTSISTAIALTPATRRTARVAACFSA